MLHVAPRGVVAPAITFAGGSRIYGAYTRCACILFPCGGHYPCLCALVLAVWVHAKTVRKKLEKYGRMENTARRRQGETVQEAFRGYAEAETSNPFPGSKRTFPRKPERNIRPEGTFGYRYEDTGSDSRIRRGLMPGTDSYFHGMQPKRTSPFSGCAEPQK